MTTKIQEFLRNGGTLEQLKERYSLNIKQHGTYPQLWQVKYDQISSPMHEPLVKECRGIIVDSNDDWACVARPFDKFWNLGDFYADKVDWANARMTEKLDGSLIVMYHYAGKWHVATSGTPDASGPVYGYPMDFKELFWKTFEGMGLKLDDLYDHFDTNYTFMFELMTPYNRIVVPHKECTVKLIGIRNRNNGKELAPMFGPPKWPCVEAIPVTSDALVIETFTRMSALSQEGWVVVDQNFNRVKVKHPQYIVLHHMRGNGTPSPKRALEVLLAGEHEEVLTYWPEWKPLFGTVGSRLGCLIAELKDKYAAIEGLQIQKDFALEAQKTRCSGALFMLRAKKTPSIDAYLANMNIDTLASILGLDNIVPEILVPTIELKAA